ncbi:MAG: Asp-tRNA(Asn)/Glu-tRNA(Gln) amidotransferase subunit GatA [Candidatus Scalindua sp. AMX11]|nr:MAG: Asp-tRNA(Asn)/Glu-tRNA(Gln) amidotransferase subunit GatA [Candidatus Scalindua sp.]NOG82264.1 Asp-tRNA(Asn)/Glu-tRNA(Gln) amidotransferase subunit GatA [Planctomycetota bacterium]RZV71445.1 MAG: Asp-tRNA(Asn)/Glu-tRNA(Gln) amidotransferase subunit GatA [Candidatus Scalindua sp. SCAELEC01]TDE64291.1 MAG: Asp-tRNA(Asn)/Glu-tRNA(Gln) amidotransferase subunit GatA [Candidatus Scalindua sp. AMX11]GJQ59931.1 MAG: glutamyl-tRNA(Gln) amidotransferase subunit A [Candidatus Scalindua sp.]
MLLHQLTAKQIQDNIVKRKISCKEVIEDLFNRINEKDSLIKAYISLDEESALERAREIDGKLSNGEDLGVLAGIPIAIKDNICTKNMKTTCASKILENFIPPYDAFVVNNLRKEDAIIIGKTNLDEFAMGSTTENSAFQITRNPWNTEYIPGGSSGGSAAAVSTDIAFMALGSDTGGSVRQPASLCGNVGLKPTYGRVSRYGLIAFASSMDQIGSFTKDVCDAALLLRVISGYDCLDSTCSTLEVEDYVSHINGKFDGLRIGVPKEFFGEGIDREVRNALMNALEIYKKNGAKLIDLSLPHCEYAIATYCIIATAEASSNLARYDGVRYGMRNQLSDDSIMEMYCRTRAEGFGDEVKRRILLGNYVLSAGYYEAYYLKASKVRNLLKSDFDEAFKKVDCIISPTSPTVASKIGEKMTDPLEMYLSDVYTNIANLVGIPGISLPCGFTNSGLPIGMQILGRHFEETQILKVAKLFEMETGFHLKKPELD